MDFDTALLRFAGEARDYHDSEARYDSVGLDAYVSARVDLKMRRFNTSRVESPELEAEIKRLLSEPANAYRKTSDGE